VGYVQGMNLIAASIVYHSTTVHDSLRVMSLLMKNHSLRNIYINDLSYGFEMSKRLVLQLRDLSFDLYNYLVQLVLFRLSKVCSYSCSSRAGTYLFWAVSSLSQKCT